MEDLDFCSPSPKPADQPGQAAKPAPRASQNSPYNPQLALEFFRSEGAVEEAPARKLIFSESDQSTGLFSKGDKMYLLLEGEVGFMLKDKSLGKVARGEIFGELAAVAGLPRTASALALAPCKLISLTEKQYLSALQKMPEFAVMLMSVMAQRLRKDIDRLGDKTSDMAPRMNGGILDSKTLDKLQEARSASSYSPGQVILREGTAGAFMFVVTEGRVAISLGGRIVETVTPGGVFGELALVDQSTREATAAAETACRLVAISRNDFLELVKGQPNFGAAMLKKTAMNWQHVVQMGQ
jgi:CRP-like cAMP-binding protein